MKFSAAIATVLASAGVMASPIQKRELGGILICEGANATGTCVYDVYEMKTCYNLTAELSQNANTFAPDGDGFACYPRIMACGGICTSPTGCTFGAVDFAYENKYNLSAIGWDKYITSFDCFLKDGTASS